MQCPHCGSQHPGPGPFCMSCGYKLSQVTTTQTSPPKTVRTPYDSEEDVVSAEEETDEPTSYVDSPSEVADVYEPSIGQMESAGMVGISIWHPFAGCGTRGRHVSWLISDQGSHADELLDIVRQRFGAREVLDATLSDELLQRKGILVDTRPYTLVRRKLTTAGLYIAQFGKDLYVSQVTYFKGPISNMRVLAVILMVAFYIIYPMLYQGTLNSINFSLLGGGMDLGRLGTVLCCIGPFYLIDVLALLILVIFSLAKFLSEKDILAALREPPNEFDIDDTVALEKALEETVREALDAVEIDRKLMPPASEYGLRHRLI